MLFARILSPPVPSLSLSSLVHDADDTTMASSTHTHDHDDDDDDDHDDDVELVL